jgi:hypothetical protein
MSNDSVAVTADVAGVALSLAAEPGDASQASIVE